MPASDLPISEQFKQAMRRMASSVCIISSASRDGQPYAMTATSVTSLSLEIPSLLVCVNQQAGIHPVMKEGNSFCVNILNEHQQDLAELCSQGPETRDRFALGQWKTGASGLPYLEDAQAIIACFNDKSICYASHTIFIGRIENIAIQGELSPLIYLDGRYRKTYPL